MKRLQKKKMNADDDSHQKSMISKNAELTVQSMRKILLFTTLAPQAHKLAGIFSVNPPNSDKDLGMFLCHAIWHNRLVKQG